MTKLNNLGDGVLLFEQDWLKFPELWAEVYVCGGPGEFARMFALAKCTGTRLPMEADFVVFTGGADVSPHLYGQQKHARTRTDPSRDMGEKALFEFCVKNGIPMVGICRGAQFLHVMNGGELYQHVSGHTGAHDIIDVTTSDRTVVRNVSSTHHQMLKINGKMDLIAIAEDVATLREFGPNSEGATMIETKAGRSIIDPEVEACFYKDTMSLCFQGHPEYKGYETFTKWFLQTLSAHIIDNGTDTLYPQEAGHPRKGKLTVGKIAKEMSKTLNMKEEK